MVHVRICTVVGMRRCSSRPDRLFAHSRKLTIWSITIAPNFSLRTWPVPTVAQMYVHLRTPTICIFAHTEQLFAKLRFSGSFQVHTFPDFFQTHSIPMRHTLEGSKLPCWVFCILCAVVTTALRHPNFQILLPSLRAGHHIASSLRNFGFEMEPGAFTSAKSKMSICTNVHANNEKKALNASCVA